MDTSIQNLKSKFLSRGCDWGDDVDCEVVRGIDWEIAIMPVLHTQRFGEVSYCAADLLLFPEGVIGFEHLPTWILLDEAPLTWLQSTTDGQVALGLSSPYDFVPEYRVELSASDRAALELSGEDRATVFCVVAQEAGVWTMNLRAPIVIHSNLRLARQIITASEQPLRYVLPRANRILRKSA